MRYAKLATIILLAAAIGYLARPAPALPEPLPADARVVNLEKRVAELDRELEMLRVSHEMYIAVMEDMDRRLVRVAGD